MNELQSNQPFTAQNQIKRLLNTNFISPYDVLNIPSEATEEEIKKQFRQLTMLLHPDKCSDPNAVEAFQGIIKNQ
jgi:DnaJ family protein C protein 8